MTQETLKKANNLSDKINKIQETINWLLAEEYDSVVSL